MGSGEAQRVRKKRTRASDADAEADDHPESSAFKRRGTPVPKRGRGRPPNSGQYLGLAKGKRELMEARRIRQAATGARVLELPAGVTSEAADSFAAKLREVLAGEARIARPVKCADLRLTGLDDSVTRDEVLAAIVAAAACPLDHVKAGEIREGRRGTGCIWVQCPVAAAKVLVSARSMRIGWSYVHVESLEPRPMKCFRCLEIGHTRLQCTSEVDRSDICYRCSAPGHKAAACLAKPHCAVAGRPAEHSVGAKGCSPPKKGKKAGRTPASQQINLNHCAGAQDLLVVAEVAEPYCIPANWMGDATGTAAIYIPDGTTPLSVKERGNGFVAADWGKYTIFSVYFSPNKTLAELETLLGDMQAAIRRVAPRPVIVAGDFNAKNTAWGSPATDVRGIAVEDWATESGLALLNCGTAQTCVRVQGGSIVDLSFASPAVAQAVRDRRVMGEVETLSDHLYIRFSVRVHGPRAAKTSKEAGVLVVT
ncbi:unnamed protein product, partial [Iphiclides podalirius]